MARLLAALWSGRVLDAARTASLLEMMSRCRTQRKRLRGRLPKGTRVAHKTGTLRPSIAADVGIIYLPPPHGHCAIAAYIAESRQSEKTQNQGIARMARVVYDFFAGPS
jgi:beta-lactamase class A